MKTILTTNRPAELLMKTLLSSHVKKPIKLADLPELCYGLIDVEMMDTGTTHVTPIIIKRGETGYYKTDWSWRKQFAKEALDQKNAALGITPEMADRMMSMSMFNTWPIE